MCAIVSFLIITGGRLSALAMHVSKMCTIVRAAVPVSIALHHFLNTLISCSNTCRKLDVTCISNKCSKLHLYQLHKPPIKNYIYNHSCLFFMCMTVILNV